MENKFKKNQFLGAFAIAAILAVLSCNVGYAQWNTGINVTGGTAACGCWDVCITDATISLSEIGAEAVAFAEVSVLDGVHETEEKVDGAVDMEKDNISAESELDTEDFMENSEKESDVKDYVKDPEKESEETEQEEPDGSAGENLTEEEIPEEEIPEEEIPEEEIPEEEIPEEEIPEEEIPEEEPSDDESESEDVIESVAKVGRQILFVGSTEGTEKNELSELVEFTDENVEYPEIIFTMPGAWVKYTVTVTNSGTVDANLAKAEILLNFDDPTYLELEEPELEDTVLKAGERSKFSFVIKVSEKAPKKLSVTGNLSVNLPYNQPVVEVAPEPIHRHL